MIPQIDNDALRKALTETQTQKKKFEKDKRLLNTYIDLKKNPEYTAIIRFLPPSENYPLWYVKGMKHKPSQGKGKPFLDLHCPKYYDPSHSCAICEYLNSKYNEFTREERDNYKRKVYFLCNVLVLNDPQNPELEGKVMLWNFPQSIYDKVTAKYTGDAMSPGSDVFNYDEKGRNFKLKITRPPGAGYYNFDGCEWLDQSPLFGGDADKINNVHANLYDLKKVINEMKAYSTSENVRKRFEVYMTPPMINEDEARFDLEPDFTPAVLRDIEREKQQSSQPKVDQKQYSAVTPTASASTSPPEDDIDF